MSDEDETCAFFLMQIWDLHLNDPVCRGVEIGDGYVFTIKTNLTDCGTIMVNLSILSQYNVLYFMIQEISFISKEKLWKSYICI